MEHVKRHKRKGHWRGRGSKRTHVKASSIDPHRRRG